MKLVIYDLSESEFNKLDINFDGYKVFSALKKYAPCQGCFNCWLKSPGRCHIKDGLENIGEIIGKSEEIIIISQNYYGGYSPSVKNILDRSIATSLPFFTYRKGKLHHTLRYKNSSKLKVYLYGDFTDFERETAAELVKVNGVNMGCKDTSFLAVNDYLLLREVLQ